MIMNSSFININPILLFLRFSLRRISHARRYTDLAGCTLVPEAVGRGRWAGIYVGRAKTGKFEPQRGHPQALTLLRDRCSFGAPVVSGLQQCSKTRLKRPLPHLSGWWDVRQIPIFSHVSEVYALLSGLGHT